MKYANGWNETSWNSTMTKQNFCYLVLIASVSQAGNLGTIFDSSVTIKPHISNVIRSSALQLRNISRICPICNTTQQIIHTVMTSRLDNNSALLYGFPANQLYRLQKTQNTAASILKFSRKSWHITLFLKELQWLPVNQRIVFKLLLIAYKYTNYVAPSYLTEMFSKYLPTRTLHSGKGMVKNLPLLRGARCS